MNRRSFLISSAGAIGASAFSSRLLAASAPARDPLIAELIRANDDAVTSYLARQERRPGHRWVGGIPDATGIYMARPTAQMVVTLACAAISRESAHYQADALVEPMRLAARCLRVLQHDDGTTDYPATNFHSTPDTAFTMDAVGPAIELLRAAQWAPLDPVLTELSAFARKAGEALATGGVHTPNHRWVVCAALARLNALFPDAKYVARIDQWLAEGVDLDPDGQFTEKSTSVYSPWSTTRCSPSRVSSTGPPCSRPCAGTSR
jgi:hypothetical protein